MRRPACVCFALVLVASCGPITRIPLNLPQRDAPLEVRVGAYRARAATLQQSRWQGAEVRIGDTTEPVSLHEARRVIENAPGVEAIFEARERRRTFAASVTAAGGVVMLTGYGVALFGPSTLSRDETLAFTITGSVGAIVTAVGFLMNMVAEADSTRAVGVYNRWLWDALALPREPVPAVSPAGLVPPALPPGTLPSWMFGPAPAPSPEPAP